MSYTYQSEVNIGKLERAACLMGGVAAMVSSVKGGKWKRLICTPIGLEMIRRGITGKCLLYDEINKRSWRRELDLRLDEMLEDSFPASDPPSTY